MNAPIAPIRRPNPKDSASGHTVRVMIVDDSLTVRTIFKRMVESEPSLQVVSTASTAEQAINTLRDQEKTDQVDVILLDLEMPGMGGLQALPTILETAQTAQVLEWLAKLAGHPSLAFRDQAGLRQPDWFSLGHARY